MRFDLPPPNPGIARLFRWVRLTGGHVDVLPDVVEIRYGWAFSATIPRSSIVSAVADKDPVKRYGANRRGNLWAVIPDAVGVVRLTISATGTGPPGGVQGQRQGSPPRGRRPGRVPGRSGQSTSA